MRQAAEGFAMPGYDPLQRRLVRGGVAGGLACRQVSLGALALAVPAILASQSPERVRRRVRRSKLLNQPRGHLGAKRVGDGAGVLAAEAEGF